MNQLKRSIKDKHTSRKIKAYHLRSSEDQRIKTETVLPTLPFCIKKTVILLEKTVSIFYKKPQRNKRLGK